jgi:hypothetical protein
MINNNKILTVSYGTFSCTLEGFDDSFGTMKAIAEYFRDLSADDRYFGAEPAQPDAQMLARIAQREISRHVEAREDEGRIVLSALDSPKAAALVASSIAEDDAEVVTKAEQNVAPAETAQDVADPQTEEPTVEPVAQADEDTAPEVLQDEAPEEAIQEEPAPEVVEELEAEVAKEPAQIIDLAEQDIVPSLPDADVEAFFADSATADEFDAGEDALDATPMFDEGEPELERAKADSIADKLKRIRAVVSQQSDAATTPDYSEDQHAAFADVKAAPVADVEILEEPLVDAQDDVLASTLRDLEDALDADDAVDAVDDLDIDLESEDDDITAILSRLEQESEDEAPVAIEELDDDADDLDDDILAAMDSIVAAPDADDLDELGDDNLFEDAKAAVEPEQSPVQAPRTRVLKVKRATLEAAIEAGKLEEYDDEEDETTSDLQPEKMSLRKTPRPTSSSLSDAAEEDLARELAELEADMETDDLSEDQETFAEQPEAEPMVEDDAAYSMRSEIHGAADDDMSRLMEETDSQMGEPEGATRRDAFAHLRAAVAAKKADEAVGGDLGDEDSDEAYRDDLANVVRPRRPVAGERNRTERPAEQRPAPLKLVAEQRIDVSDNASVTPVRPRRVAAVIETPTTSPDTSSFADFAADVGAQKLPDLLEAAAAYLSFVEGHEVFSRPQLMTKVRQVEKENFTREEGLRSFGLLLREGKIQKLKGGRFQASDHIGFKQDARAAG